jgi:mono/diheme cytochrome c family protein
LSSIISVATLPRKARREPRGRDIVARKAAHKEKSRMLRSVILGAVFCLAAGGASAQDVGDPEAGYRVASDICSACHMVEPTDGAFPEPDPLPFEDPEPLPFEQIANTPGVTAMALFAWMGTSHPTMPDIVLPDNDLRDVVAYILSLKDGP